MILSSDDEVILGSGGQTKKFSIATSAKAFKILSSNLYKNKIRAIVRELSCNCLDAHFLNGFEGQFEIKAPNQLDPRFIIRDFGPGLSDDDVMNLYTTYFASTKSGSNDFIGALGLGSKSPFSYTETFTVVSNFNGVSSVYTAMLDNGEPVILPVHKEPTPEGVQSGIEITIPVKTADISEWHKEIMYVVRPMGEAKARVLGIKADIDWFPEFEEYHGRTNVSYNLHETNGLFAVYGNIVYPLSEVRGLDASWLRSKYRVVYIKFPLGELDIASSREELSLDETTTANIVKRVNTLDLKVLEQDIKEYGEETNIRKLYRDISNLTYDAKQILNRRNTKFGPGNYTLRALEKMVEVRPEFQSAGVVYSVCFDPKLKRIKSKSNTSQVSTLSMFGPQVSKLRIIIDDDKRSRISVVRTISSILYSKDPKAVELAKQLPKAHEDLLFVNPESEYEMDLLPELLKHMRDDEVIMYKTSELKALVEPFIEVKAKEIDNSPRSKTPTAYHYKFVNGQWLKTNLFTRVKEVEEFDGYALFVNGTTYTSFDTETKVHNVQDHHIQTLAAFLKINEYYVIRPSLQKKVVREGQLTDMLPEIYDKFVELIDDVDHLDYVATSGKAQQYTRHTNKHPELGFMNKWFSASGSTSKEYADLMQMYNIMRYWTTGGEDNLPLRVQHRIGLDTVSKLLSHALNNAIKLIDKFEAENIVVSNFLKSRYDLSDEAVIEIAKLMGQ